MNLCNIIEIREILSRHGFHFSKSLGQNFLTANWVPEGIAEQCGVDKNSGVVEIGPGMGCLTNELSKLAHHVVAIELDTSLFPVLEETLAPCSNVKVIQGDVLKVNLPEICKENFENMDIHACANLPYYITTPAIAALIDSKCFKSITVMVQKEVAKRICAKVSTKDYGAFSLYCNYHTKPEIILDVPAGCFVPMPKVDSAVVRMEVLDNPPVDTNDSKLLFALIRSAFNQRRKNIANSLSGALSPKFDKATIIKTLTDNGYDTNLRGENLSLEDYAKIANLFT